MPCHGGPSISEPDVRAERDLATRLLCSVLNKLEALPKSALVADILGEEELDAWWTAHKELDRRRKRLPLKMKLDTAIARLRETENKIETIRALGGTPKNQLLLQVVERQAEVDACRLAYEKGE